MDDGLSSLEGEMFSYTADLSDMKVSLFAYSVDVGLEGEGKMYEMTWKKAIKAINILRRLTDVGSF